jgi:L-threonylcarbamoyladenylate synthase
MFITEIDNALKVLKQEQTILYATDTVWGIGCDATNEKAVSKIFEIKKRENSKSLVVLVSSLDMLRSYIEEVPENVIDILSAVTKPTTIIYRNPKNLAQNVIADDNTIAIRIVNDEFCENLIRLFDRPIVSTSANISGDPTPRSFKDISKPILDSVDYIVNLAKEEINLKSSSIIQIMEDNKIKIIRD